MARAWGTKHQVLLWPRKRNYENKTTTKLKLSNGDFTSDQSEILREQMHFYKTLYSSDKNRSQIQLFLPSQKISFL